MRIPIRDLQSVPSLPTARRSPSGALRRAPRRFHIERLEDRLLMDGAGFVHTSPEPDPDSVVGVAGIHAHDDYVKTWSSTGQLRIDVLANDPLPEGATSLRIKSVSATARGASVTISDDGRRIVYTPPEAGVSYDNFYYIVEDEDGRLGKANVTVRMKSSGSGYVTPSGKDLFRLFEDGPEATLNVLANDGSFQDGEIVEVATANLGTLRISDDGKSLLYRPNPATTGSDRFEYTVRRSDGETATHSVSVWIFKPFEIVRDGDNGSGTFAIDIGTGLQQWNLLANDQVLSPIPQEPRIVDVEYPGHVGELRISQDGRSVTFNPAEDFLGQFTFTYTVRYGSLEHQTIGGSVNVRVQNTFLAVDDWFAVDVDSGSVNFDVLANDPTLHRRDGNYRPLPDVTLAIVETSAGSHGGQVTINDDGTLAYTPAESFSGDESFSYVVVDSNGHRDSATVTVHVAAPIGDPVGVPKFILPGELEQFLIDQAVERYKDQFGLTQRRYTDSSYYDPVVGAYLNFDGARFSTNSDRSHSETNTQEEDVDEADIVETDGRYLYTFSGGKLVIADLKKLKKPKLVSFTELDGGFTEMYLQGDRITLIDRGSYRDGESIATFMVLDVSDRRDPAVVERTEIDGRIVDTRAVGDRVYVAASGIDLPELESHALDGAGTEEYDVRVKETLDEYVARVRATMIEQALPNYRTYDGSGELVSFGLLTEAAQIHKPIDAADNALLSLVTFDAGDDVAGPLSSTGIFTDQAAVVYMSGDSIYVLRNSGGRTAIFKFNATESGATDLTATGEVEGVLLNQFSVDEHDGRLRIATTQTVNETVDRRVRQQQRFNNLFVLEQQGASLAVVGSVENLAPTETIKSVRFLDDRAYVVTFRVIDPLFAVDLGDPTNPKVEGALKIPGFSDYLHPVGEDYVIGIGRDADEITGALGAPQISLFYVGDLSNPTLVDQVTMEGVRWASSEAFSDHHAVAYFAEHQVLTIPVHWTETLSVGYGYTHQSAIWTFEIDVNGTGEGAIEVTGNVHHDGDARRSVRIGEALITVSEKSIKINRLHNPDIQVAELYVGALPEDDVFTIQEDSRRNVLDVRANDHAGSRGQPPRIVAVTQPTQMYSWHVTESETVGRVRIAANGRSLVFTPKENFYGAATFEYTVFDEVRGEQTATVTVYVENVPDDPDAVDDHFTVDSDSTAVQLDVLANDVNHDQSRAHPCNLQPFEWRTIDLSPARITGLVVNSFVLTDFSYVQPLTLASLSITEVGPTSHGGIVEMDDHGQGLTYTPAAGFVGVETFTYTIATLDGRTDTASVSISVGVAPPSETGTEAGSAKSRLASLETFAMRKSGGGMPTEDGIRGLPVLETRRSVTPVGRTSGTERFEQFENVYHSRADAPLRRATERRPRSPSPRLVDLAISEFERNELKEFDDELASELVSSLDYFRG